MPIYEAVLLILIGATVTLFGYRIKKIAFFVIWFFLGYSLINFLMPTLTNVMPQIAEGDFWRILLPIAGGLLLALLGFSIEKLCLGGICFALVMMITAQYFGTEIQTMAIGGVIGVIIAGVAVMLMKPATIIATSAAGAYALTLAIISLATGLNFETYYWPMLIGITVLGSVIQFATTRRIQ